jgi:hypothetical protein
MTSSVELQRCDLLTSSKRTDQLLTRGYFNAYRLPQYPNPGSGVTLARELLESVTVTLLTSFLPLGL